MQFSQKFFSLSAALLAAIGTTQAHIVSITAPATATSGGQLVVTCHTANYIQNWDDYNVLFSVATIGQAAPFIGPGSILNSVDLLERDKVTTGSGSFDIELFLNPSKVQPGKKYVLNAAITSVVGVSLDTILTFSNTSFTT